MRAIGYRKPSPALDALEAFEIPQPRPESRDLLVEVRAVAVNPVDYKVASGTVPEAGGIKVVGYDAAGVVVEAGRETRLFKPGDEVFYAGSIGRQGANAEYHLVDERIVGRKPRSLDFPAAAALPPTSIHRLGGDVRPARRRQTRSRRYAGDSDRRRRWRRRFDRHPIGAAADRSRRRATASRPETARWAKDMGAHHVVDHKKPLAPQVGALGL